MKTLTGFSASPGIAIGKPFLYIHQQPTVPRYDIVEEEVGSEMERFRSAISTTVADLEAVIKQSEGHADADQLSIIEAHKLIAQDPEFDSRIQSLLEDDLMNVEWILYRYEQQLVDRLNKAESDAIRERSSDLRDVTGRVLGALLEHERFSLADLTEEVIVVTHDLMPSDAIGMKREFVKGLIMEAGGPTSHTAILARAFEIPSVFGIASVTRMVIDADVITVDGNHGTVVIDPDPETRGRVEEQISRWHQHELQLMRLNDLPAETKDGKLILLKANIEVPEEVDGVLSHGADGIGLYRSEFLFMNPGRLPSEEDQYRAYRSVVESIPDKPVTIRTLDVGGDKVVPQFDGFEERNPILGWRAIRFCLSNLDVFRTQLRALLRTASHGRLEIMFPMISGIEELTDAMNFLEETRRELSSEGVEIPDDLPVGTMIEVPSAAMVADILAKKSHFFSIGTNDLIQYTLAVDRGNQKITYLYEPFHPAVLRMLKLVIDNAHDNGIPVAMCGEMAGDPVATVLLLGLGLDEYSMSAGSIPEVKRIIRSTSVREAEEVVGAAMEMRSFKEVDRFVRKLMEERFGVSVC